MEKRIKQAVEGMSTQTLENVIKNINAGTNHIVTVNDGHIKKASILVKHLEYIYYNLY